MAKRILSNTPLLSVFQRFSKDNRVGLESEAFVFSKLNKKRVPYWVPEAPVDLVRILRDLAQIWGGEEIREGPFLLGLRGEDGAVSLEPGGQIEFSSAPMRTLRELESSLLRYQNALELVLGRQGCLLGPYGVDPCTPQGDVPWIPKKRYEIMRRWMPRRGTLGLAMMGQTASTQVNLDVQSEQDSVRKLRLATKLQPLVSSLFANSPFFEGRLTDFQSWRMHIWEETDPERTGLPLFAFEGGMGGARYVEYLLDVPMYLIQRGEEIFDVAGENFRKFWNGRPLKGLPSWVEPQLSDFETHLTTTFLDVRLKPYLELRGADAGDMEHNLALAAFWMGIFYDEASFRTAEALVEGWEVGKLNALRTRAIRQGPHASFEGCPLWAWAEPLLLLSEEGLKETGSRRFLKPLFRRISEKKTPSDLWKQTVAQGKTDLLISPQ